MVRLKVYIRYARLYLLCRGNSHRLWAIMAHERSLWGLVAGGHLTLAEADELVWSFARQICRADD